MAQEKAVTDGARGGIGGGPVTLGDADRAWNNGPPAIGRLDDDGVRLGCGFRRDDMEDDVIRNGGPSSRKLSQTGNPLLS